MNLDECHISAIHDPLGPVGFVLVWPTVRLYLDRDTAIVIGHNVTPVEGPEIEDLRRHLFR